MRVAFTNGGTGEASLTTHFSRFLLLDDAGDPVHWGFVNDETQPTDGIVPVGTSGSAQGAVLYAGTSSSVRVLIDFDVPNPNGLSAIPNRR